MPCHGCATNFSLFVKELSCPKCGFSYCNKCLKEKVCVNDKAQKICSYCVKKMTKPASSVSLNDPPALLLKRLETLENPAKPPITIFKHKGKLSNLKTGLSPVDQQIYERLEKLKDRKLKSLPSETEIKQRLMVLKGMKEENVSETAGSVQTRTKSEQEEVDDLLKQYMNEMVLEEKMYTENELNMEDIEERLGKLKGAEHSKASTFMESDDGESVSKKIIERAIAEGRLEKKLENSMSKSDSDDESKSMDLDPEEGDLPWCIICNEDAILKCLGCDGSLYCKTCFTQGHEFFEMQDHKTVEIGNESVSELKHI